MSSNPPSPNGWDHTFSSPEAVLLSVTVKNHLWEGPIFRARREDLFRILRQSDFQIWTSAKKQEVCVVTFPEVTILGADQKEHGLWEWESTSLTELIPALNLLGSITTGKHLHGERHCESCVYCPEEQLITQWFQPGLSPRVPVHSVTTLDVF